MFVIHPFLRRGIFNVFTGNQLIKSLREWVSPPNPSTNHDIASDIHQEGSAQWFFEGSMFDEWKSMGSLLWIYGKRTFFRFFTDRTLITLYAFSGIGEDNPLVSYRSASTLRCAEFVIQFLHRTGYRNSKRGGISVHGILLFRLPGS